MAITDIIETLGGQDQVRIVELGKIKIGGLGKERESQGGRAYRQPEKHDHFTITSMNRGPSAPGGSKGDLLPDKYLMDQLIAQYGDPDGKLRQIPVRVLDDELSDVLQTAFVWYHGARCCARSDGREVTWFNDPRNGKANKEPVVEDWSPDFLELTNTKGIKLFKLHSVFNCVVAAKDARWGGIYKFRTTSVISFKQLYATLVNIQQLTGGILRGMPLMLRLRSIQVAPEGKTSTVYVVHAELVGSEIQQIQQMAIEQAKWRIENKLTLEATQKQFRKLLVGPGQESSEDAADIAGEFHPETIEMAATPEGVFGFLDEDDTLNADEGTREDGDVIDGEAEGEATDSAAQAKQADPSKSPSDSSKPAENDTTASSSAADADSNAKPPAADPKPKKPEDTHSAFVAEVKRLTADTHDPTVVAKSFQDMPIRTRGAAVASVVLRRDILAAIRNKKYDFVKAEILAE